MIATVLKQVSLKNVLSPNITLVWTGKDCGVFKITSWQDLREFFHYRAASFPGRAAQRYTSMKIIKRTAKDEDKDFLYFLNETVYRSLVERINGVWDDKFQREYFDQKWRKAGYQIIEKAKIKIGTIWIEYGPDQYTLKEIQILPDFQNQGIGTELIQSEIESAKKANVPMRLRLLKSNPAQSLYKRLGFKTYEEAGNYLYMELNV